MEGRNKRANLYGCGPQCASHRDVTWRPMANLLPKHLRHPVRTGRYIHRGRGQSRRRERDDDEFMVLIKRALPIGRFAALRPPGQKVAVCDAMRPLVHYTRLDGRCCNDARAPPYQLYGVIAKSGCAELDTRGIWRSWGVAKVYRHISSKPQLWGKGVVWGLDMGTQRRAQLIFCRVAHAFITTAL